MFFKTIGNFVKSDFNFFYYLFGGGLCVVVLYFNYFYHTPYFFSNWTYSLDPPYKGFLSFLFFNLGVYFLLLLVLSIIQKDFSLFKKKNVYFKIFFFFFLYSFNRIYPLSFSSEILKEYDFTYKVVKFINDLAVFYSTFFITFICLLVFFLLYKKREMNFFGVTTQNLKKIIKIYLPIFAFILPLIILAVSNQNLRNYYPLFGGFEFSQIFNVPLWQSVSFFEIGYGLFLFNTELMFRGFLVLSIGKEIKQRSVFPASVIYCFIHLGKPLGECISSFFGGYVLGIFAYKHKSIFLGVFIHIILAWSMELITYWLK